MTKVDSLTNLDIKFVLIVCLVSRGFVTKGTFLNDDMLSLLSQAHFGQTMRGTKVDNVRGSHFLEWIRRSSIIIVISLGEE